MAACTTLLRAARAASARRDGWHGPRCADLQFFIGNNRLQLQQVGAKLGSTLAGTPGHGSMAALMLRPIGTLSMIGLMLHGAMGRLGEAAGVEGFEFQHMVVKARP